MTVVLLVSPILHVVLVVTIPNVVYAHLSAGTGLRRGQLESTSCNAHPDIPQKENDVSPCQAVFVVSPPVTTRKEFRRFR